MFWHLQLDNQRMLLYALFYLPAPRRRTLVVVVVFSRSVLDFVLLALFVLYLLLGRSSHAPTCRRVDFYF